MRVRNILSSIFVFSIILTAGGTIYLGYLRHRLVIAVKEIQIKDWGHESGFVTLLLEWEIHNPHNYPLRMDSLNVQVFAGEIYLGSQKVEKPILIPSNRSRRMALEVYASLGGLGETKLTALTRARKAWRVRGTAYIRTRFGLMPYSFFWED